MTNRPKAIGTAAESAIRKAMRARGINAERTALHGTQDLGDLHAYIRAGLLLVVEAKGGKVADPLPWARRAAWLAEADREAGRAAERSLDPVQAVPLLVTKRKGSGQADDWHAHLDLVDLLDLLGAVIDRPLALTVRLGDLLDLIGDQRWPVRGIEALDAVVYDPGAEPWARYEDGER